MDGVIVREVLLDGRVSAELLGVGDLIRPRAGGNESLLGEHVRWQVLEDARVAVLDQRVHAVLTGYLEVIALLMDRAYARAERLAALRAIARLNLIDRRLLALFWHLAQRWGRVSADGIVVQLRLSHRLLGELVGARRPTVSTALGALRREGRLTRRTGASWLLAGLAGEPVKGMREPAAGRREPADASRDPLDGHRRRLA